MTLKEVLEYWKFKHERAKNYTDDHWEADERREHEEYVEALQIAVKAIEKQIPVKPKEYEDKYYACNCGNILLMKYKRYPTELTPKSEELPYCLACGQKLDWNASNNTCVCCGEIIPEGRQVCPKCERG